jgi:sugar lactone lactonase YvrE
MKTRVVAIFVAALFVTGGLAPAQSNDKYVVNKEWAQLPADMPWNQSTSWVSPDGKGNVVVLVRAAPYFRVFSRDGKFVKAFGDAGTFQGAHGLGFDRDGFIWATDNAGHAVYKFSPEGKLLMTLGKRGSPGDDTSRDLFNQPAAIFIAANGDIYVADGYVNSRIMHFAKDGKFIRIIGGTKGSAPGQLQLVHGVVVDSRGRIIVGDSDNKRISVFDKDGKFVEIWPFPSRGGLLIRADDTIYASDVNAGAINIIKDGKLVDSITGLGRPHGIGMDTDGTLYAADSMNRVVMKISPKK